MRDVIQPIATEDGHFHDGNPATGELGTIVPAGWLNEVQSALQMSQAELIAVLTAADIAVDPANSGQLVAAIQKLCVDKMAVHLNAISPHPQYANKATTLAGYSINNAVGFYGVPPAAKAEQIIYATPFGLMEWVVGAGLYRSLDCGSVILHPSASPRVGTIKANGATLSKTTYAGLWSWVQDNSLSVPSASWSAGTAMYADLGGDNFRLPDLRGEFLRAWDDGRGVDSGRAFGMAQGDAIRNITGSVSSFYKSQSFSASGALGISAYGTTPAKLGIAGADPGDNSTIDFNASRVVQTGPENRPRNVALTICIRY